MTVSAEDQAYMLDFIERYYDFCYDQDADSLFEYYDPENFTTDGCRLTFTGKHIKTGPSEADYESLHGKEITISSVRYVDVSNVKNSVVHITGSIIIKDEKHEFSETMVFNWLDNEVFDDNAVITHDIFKLHNSARGEANIAPLKNNTLQGHSFSLKSHGSQGDSKPATCHSEPETSRDIQGDSHQVTSHADHSYHKTASLQEDSSYLKNVGPNISSAVTKLMPDLNCNGDLGKDETQSPKLNVPNLREIMTNEKNASNGNDLSQFDSLVVNPGSAWNSLVSFEERKLSDSSSSGYSMDIPNVGRFKSATTNDTSTPVSGWNIISKPDVKLENVKSTPYVQLAVDPIREKRKIKEFEFPVNSAEDVDW